MLEKNIKIIEIQWEGPFSINKISKFNNPSDYGIYQIYGTHTIFGENSLLYIGKAEQQNFCDRFIQHKEWLAKEISNLQVYIGRIGGVKQPNNNIWTESIDSAEKLLIYFCSPPYNFSNINSFGNHKNKVILNFGKKNRLPYEVSTLYNESEFWNESKIWKPFIYKHNEK